MTYESVPDYISSQGLNYTVDGDVVDNNLFDGVVTDDYSSTPEFYEWKIEENDERGQYISLTGQPGHVETFSLEEFGEKLETGDFTPALIRECEDVKPADQGRV